MTYKYFPDFERMKPGETLTIPVYGNPGVGESARRWNRLHPGREVKVKKGGKWWVVRRLFLGAVRVVDVSKLNIKELHQLQKRIEWEIRRKHEEMATKKKERL